MLDRFPSDIAPSPEALESRVGEEMVLLHLGNDTYYGLDAMGTRIWTQLKAGTPLPAIRDRIAAEHGLDARTVEADMAPFLDDLLKNELLVHG
ncbi:PqqD family protein [Rubellimicrobium aerolatum]|uniref:PqqD family protein n=1 Tax=Rubellimicrobium aerolatum TaxID=490979 RepID=A0ABW0S983_9RHOB|nr:PqqD family protein [Rubellimicrobium aerolatum]MBP1804834.1 hypothetical protein [Rubellimicrobium aerolatum]